MTAQEKAELIRTALEDKKGEDICIYDLQGRSNLCDFVVIASASSSPHLRALSVNVERELAKIDSHPRMSGDAESAWIILDDVDVMVHMFLPDARKYYDIEKLWTRAPAE